MGPISIMLDPAEKMKLEVLELEVQGKVFKMSRGFKEEESIIERNGGIKQRAERIIYPDFDRNKLIGLMRY